MLKREKMLKNYYFNNFNIITSSYYNYNLGSKVALCIQKRHGSHIMDIVGPFVSFLGPWASTELPHGEINKIMRIPELARAQGVLRLFNHRAYEQTNSYEFKLYKSWRDFIKPRYPEALTSVKVPKGTFLLKNGTVAEVIYNVETTNGYFLSRFMKDNLHSFDEERELQDDSDIAETREEMFEKTNLTNETGITEFLNEETQLLWDASRLNWNENFMMSIVSIQDQSLIYKYPGICLSFSSHIPILPLIDPVPMLPTMMPYFYHYSGAISTISSYLSFNTFT